MTYQMAATIVTLNDLERYSSVAGLFKWNPSNTCAAFYTISTDSVLARFLCISRASCSDCAVISITAQSENITGSHASDLSNSAIHNNLE